MNAYDLQAALKMATVPPLYAQDGKEDPMVFVKLFTPSSSFTWYVTEYDPDQQVGFGFVTSHIVPEGEFGYFSLKDLSELKDPIFKSMPGVEVDLYFDATPLSQIRAHLM